MIFGNVIGGGGNIVWLVVLCVGFLVDVVGVIVDC